MAGDVFEFVTFEGLIIPAAQFQGTGMRIIDGKVEICELTFEKAEIEGGIVGD